MPALKPSHTLRIDQLEPRTVPSTATLSQGTLAVAGTISNDTITVNEAGGKLSIVNTKILYNGQLYNSIPVAWASRVYVSGSWGNDTITVNTLTKKATIIGGLGNDNITGSALADEILGRNGDDTITGGGGNDKLFGEAGDDLVLGEDGNDTLFGGDGNDTLVGGEGDDLLYCEAGDDLGSGGNGNDKVLGNVGDDALLGGAGNDFVQGEDGNDNVAGDAGNDTSGGGSGSDTITGGTEDDELVGDAGNDSLDGGTGNDTIHGSTGDDRASGGLGDDIIFGDSGSDTLHGDDGNDSVGGGLGTDFVFGDLGDDYVTGGDLGDIVDGGGGSDTVIGGGGDNGGGDDGGENGGGAGGGSNSSATVLQVIRSQWNDGATNDIIIRDTGTTAINGWKLEFDADFDVTEVWNAQLVSKVGNHYTIQNIPNFWNTRIAPNTLITIGFNSRLDPEDTTNITNIELNDKPLTGDGGGNGGTVPVTGTVFETIRQQWEDGSTNDVTIRNTGTKLINGWTITFEADFDITNVWNAQLVGQVGNKYMIRNIPNFWNAKIAPNTQITIGFNTRLEIGDSTEIRNVVLTGNNP